MCFHYAYIADKIETAKRYGIENPPGFEPMYHANAFGNPDMPVITNEEPDNLNFFKWGLIPHWIKSKEDAKSISKKTANARSETVFKKPSYRGPIKKKRCIIPASGFYEWRHEGKEKIPHYIQLKDEDIFSFAGIWESWTDKGSGEVINSYSILTIAANELMSYVHNHNKRMPIILKREDEKYWLSDLKDEDEIKNAIYQYPSDKMKYTVIDNKNLWEWQKNRLTEG